MFRILWCFSFVLLSFIQTFSWNVPYFPTIMTFGIFKNNDFENDFLHSENNPTLSSDPFPQIHLGSLVLYAILPLYFPQTLSSISDTFFLFLSTADAIFNALSKFNSVSTKQHCWIFVFHIPQTNLSLIMSSIVKRKS